jgi:NAD(P)H-dependent FMN reductase
MKVAIVSGSHRIQSQSSKVALFVQNVLNTGFPSVETYFLDLGKSPLPDWEESKWEESEYWEKRWSPVSLQLKESAALITVSPEWGGMVPSRLKNLFLLCDDDELAHKPGLIISVSAGRGGSYPVTELRISSYKNTRLLWIPEHVIIQNVEDVLNKPFSVASDADKYIQDRLLYSLKLLMKYAECLSDLRRSGIIDHENFPYGM